MANSRFLIINLVESATLKNGTGGGAPARDETSPYVMERVQYGDRNTLWTSSATPGSPINVEWDLGAATSVACGAMLGARSVDPTQTLQLAVYSASAYPGGPWTLRGITSASTLRDMGTTFNSASARYWRMQITPSVPSKFSVGRLWLGVVTDLGVYHSPGAGSSPFRNRIEQAQANGTFVINDLGDPGRDISLPFNQIDSTLLSTLQGLSAVSGSLVYIDPDGNFYECIVRGGRVNVGRQFTTMWNASLDLARLP